MGAIVGNLPAKGVIKQGSIIGSLDFTATGGTASKWTFKLVRSGDRLFLFGAHSSNNTYAPFTSDLANNISDSDKGVLKDIIKAAARPAFEYTTYGVTAIPSDTTADIYYTDGNGNFKDSPYGETTNTDIVSNILSAVGNTDTTNTGTTTKKWYQKVWVWILGGTVLTIGGILVYKNKKK